MRYLLIFLLILCPLYAQQEKSVSAKALIKGQGGPAQVQGLVFSYFGKNNIGTPDLPADTIYFVKVDGDTVTAVYALATTVSAANLGGDTLRVDTLGIIARDGLEVGKIIAPAWGEATIGDEGAGFKFYGDFYGNLYSTATSSTFQFSMDLVSLYNDTNQDYATVRQAVFDSILTVRTFNGDLAVRFESVASDANNLAGLVKRGGLMYLIYTAEQATTIDSVVIAYSSNILASKVAPTHGYMVEATADLWDYSTGSFSANATGKQQYNGTHAGLIAFEDINVVGTPTADKGYGKRYWMANSPITNYSGESLIMDELESADLQVSADGITWTWPNKLLNPPIEAVNDSNKTWVYNGHTYKIIPESAGSGEHDPDIVYDSSAQAIYYYTQVNNYADTTGDGTSDVFLDYLFCLKVKYDSGADSFYVAVMDSAGNENALTMQRDTTVARYDQDNGQFAYFTESPAAGPLNNFNVPSVVWDGDQWRCYVQIMSGYGTDRIGVLYGTAPYNFFAGVKDVTFEWDRGGGTVRPWHFDVIWNDEASRFEMIFQTQTDDSENGNELYFAYSTNDTHFVALRTPISFAGIGSFGSREYYRPTMVHYPSTSAYRPDSIDVMYSALGYELTDAGNESFTGTARVNYFATFDEAIWDSLGGIIDNATLDANLIYNDGTTRTLKAYSHSNKAASTATQSLSLVPSSAMELAKGERTDILLGVNLSGDGWMQIENVTIYLTR